MTSPSPRSATASEGQELGRYALTVAAPVRHHERPEPDQSGMKTDLAVRRANVEPEAVGDEPAPTPTESADRWRRSIWSLVLALVLIVAATWFSNAQSVEDIATQGAIGVRSEAALSAAAVSRNRVAQAILIGHAVELEVALSEELESSVASARLALDELAQRTQQVVVELGEAAGSIGSTSSDLQQRLGTALDSTASGDLEEADSAMAAVDEAFGILAADLAAARDGALIEIVVAKETAGQVAVGARILVAFLIPMAAVLVYRFIAVRAARRRELQRDLAQERATLHAKEELIANISHELRTPLTGILGFSQLAALGEDIDAGEHRLMAGIVAGEASELSRMVDDLLTSARDHENALGLTIEAVDPSEELDAVLIPATIAGETISTDVSSIEVLADRLRLRQILRNLVSNALKHGGPEVSLHGAVNGDRYQLSVIDDGDGVPEELVGRLFTRFFHKGTAPLTQGSVGLGLSIAHQLATIMDGTLKYSRHDGRTHFTLTLPLAK